jgi:asparagine synthase (glutamine-hydrolysing)
MLGTNPKAAGLLEFGGSYASAYLLRRGLFMPWELGAVLPRETIVDGLRRLAPLQLISETLNPRPRSAHAKVAVLESSLYLRNQLLRDTDWASMAHSVEVRVPLVDRILLRRVAAAASTRHARAGLPKAALALSPRRPLPERVLSRPKTGFTTPIAEWLQVRATSAPDAAEPARSRLAPVAHWSRRWAERLAPV